MANWRSISERLSALWAGSVGRAFPERQFLVRDHGRVRCFTLGSIHQLLISGAFAACLLWALLSTAAYVDSAVTLAAKEDQITRKANELEGVKANYQAAFGQLEDFQAIFSGITCEIADIQDSLVRISEKNIGPVKRGAGPSAMPRLDPDAGGCRVVADAKAPGALNDPTAEQEAVRLRVGQLESGLVKLRASHNAFLERSASIAALRIGALERTLNAVGIDTRSLASDAPRTEHYGRGGPYVPTAPGLGQSASFNPVALFNTHADHLDNLTLALHALPLAAPLIEYEVTSPFGARNDPINALTGIHEGIDLGAPMGTPVLATGDGKVVWAGPRDRYGTLVELDHGLGLHTRYAHLSRVLVGIGDKVQRGTPIGLLGDTGRSTGPHLHYEVRMDDQATNPMKFITAGRDVLQGQ